MFRHVSYVGDVTAIRLIDLQADDSQQIPLLLAGTGSVLHVYRQDNASLLWRGCILPEGIRIHGFDTMPATPHGVLLAIHGDRYVQVLRITCGPHGRHVNVTILLPPQRFPAWTHHILLLEAPLSCDVNLGSTSSTELACSDSTTTADCSVTPGGSARECSTCMIESPGLGSTCTAECTSRKGERTSMCSTGSTVCSTSSTAAVSLAVGLSNNSVHLLPVLLNDGPADGQADQAMGLDGSLLASCSERSLLYSMCIFHARQEGRLLVAAGTIFLDVLVWQTPTARDPKQRALPQTPLYRLKGHEGSIHRVRWAADGRSIASGSDDRTLRIWSLPTPEPCATSAISPLTEEALNKRAATSVEGVERVGDAAVSSMAAAGGLPVLDTPVGGGLLIRETPVGGGVPVPETPAGELLPDREIPLGGGVPVLAPVRVMYGHNGRIWDVQWGDGLVVTASEDCTCRVWSLTSGACLETLRGHTGRGVWCCFLQGSHLASAGNDAAIRLWTLPTLLATHPPRLTRNPTGGRASMVPGQNPSSSGRAGEGLLASGPGDGETGTKENSGAGTSCEGIVLRPPGLGHNGKPKGDEKIKCVAFAREGLLLVATAGGVLWRVGFGKPHMASGLWEKVWEGTPQSPINCLTVVSPSPRATVTPDTSSREGSGGNGFEDEDMVLLGLQNGRAVGLWEDGQGGERGTSAEGEERPASEMARETECIPTFRSDEVSPEGGEWTSAGLAGGRTAPPRGCRESGEGPALEASQEPGMEAAAEGGRTAHRGECGESGGGPSLQAAEEAGEEAGAEGGVAAAGWAGKRVLRDLEWEVDSGRPVLRVLAPGRPECGLVVTITTAKTLRLWALRSSGGTDVQWRGRAMCVGEATSPFSARVLAAEVVPGQHLLVCGDQAGHVFAYHLPTNLMTQLPEVGATSPCQLQLVANLWAVHESSMVSLIRSCPDGSISSGGRDGIVMHYRYTPPPHLACALSAGPNPGVASPNAQGDVAECRGGNVPETGDDPREGFPGTLVACNADRLTAVTVVTHDVTGDNGERLVCGFQAADWVVYSMTRRVVLRKVPCGGWRRPYDALVLSAENLIFAYCKDGEIHVISHGAQILQSHRSGDFETLGGNPLSSKPLGGIPLVRKPFGDKPLGKNSIGGIPLGEDPLGDSGGAPTPTFSSESVSETLPPAAEYPLAEKQGEQNAVVDGVGAHTRNGGNVGAEATLSGMAGPRTLNLIHHGREVHCVAILARPTFSGNEGNVPALDGETSTAGDPDNAGQGSTLGGGERGSFTSVQRDEADERVGAGASTREDSDVRPGPPGDRRILTFSSSQGDAADAGPVELSARREGERSHGPYPALASLGGSTGSSSARDGIGKMPRVLGPLAVFTGSEDGTLRRMMLRCPSSQPPARNFNGGACSADLQAIDSCHAASADSQARGSCHPATADSHPLHNSLLVGEHPAGSVVRAMAVVALPSNSIASGSRHIIITAGSKEVLSAWLVTWDEAAGLRHEWLSTRPPPRGGLRRKSLRTGIHDTFSDQRYLAVTAVLGGSCQEAGIVINVVAAASDASLRVIAFTLATRQWTVVADLEYHPSPVLSLASLERVGEHQGHSQFVFSGATDGSVAVWDIASIPAAAQNPSGIRARDLNPAAQKPSVHPRGSNPPGMEIASVQPLITLPGMHQSGVNALSAAFSGDSQVVLVTGGDDQGLRVILLNVDACESSSCALESDALGRPQLARVSVRATLPVDNAHFSALKGVWTNGREIFSVGLDQLIRAWRITLSRSALGGEDMYVGGVSSSDDARCMEDEAREQDVGTAGESVSARGPTADEECAGVTTGEGEDAGVTTAEGEDAGVTLREREHAGFPVGEEVCSGDTLGGGRDAAVTGDTRGEGREAGVTRDTPGGGRGAGVTRDTLGDGRSAGVTQDTPGDERDAGVTLDSTGDGRDAGVTRSCSARDGFAIVQGPVLRVDETAQGRLQVLEPGAMTVFPGNGSVYTLAIVGRGTEILTCDHSKSV